MKQEERRFRLTPEDIINANDRAKERGVGYQPDQLRTSPLTTLGMSLSAQRIRLELTPDELAQRLNTPRETVIDIELGLLGTDDLILLTKKLEEALEFETGSVDDLFVNLTLGRKD
jgi:DNA-binding XRE family transcriptional regulator